MKKFTPLLSAFLILILITGCDSVFEPAEPEYAPDNIYNKTLEFDGRIQRTYDFNSSGECEIETSHYLNEILTKSPTYTYTKTSAQAAKLTVKYSEETSLAGFSANYDNIFTLILNFTSATEGTLSGNWQEILTAGSGKSKTISYTNEHFELN